MPDVLTRLTLKSVTGLEKDSVTNSFAWEAVPDLASGTLHQLNGAAASFLTVVPTGGLTTMASFLSPELVEGAGQLTVEAYDITGKLGTNPATGKPWLIGSPLRTSVFDIDVNLTGAAGLPGEVAFVVTLEATGRDTAQVEIDDADVPPDGKRNRPKQRRTGRVFVGPLNASCLASVAGVTRPAANIRDTARLAVQEMAQRGRTNVSGARLAVWSRKDAETREVVAVSTDDAFDTQRRRGVAPTARQRLTLAFT